MKSPKISVIMSVHNASLFLQEAIESILKQSFRDFEFIIVNDGVDNIATDILNEYRKIDKRIKIIENTRCIGLTKSLIKAVHLADGEYIARMDADDIAMPERLFLQQEYMRKNPDLDFCGSSVFLIDENNRILKIKKMPLKNVEIKEKAMSFCPIIHPTLFIKKSVIQEKNYNSEFVYAQDYDLILRLLKKYKAANIAKPLLKYRVGTKQISLKNLKQQEKFALNARWNALTNYGYSWSDSWKCLKPLFSYLVPSFLKEIVYKKIYWNL